MKEIVYYKVLWENFPPEVATWEPESAIHDDFIDEFEASLEATPHPSPSELPVPSSLTTRALPAANVEVLTWPCIQEVIRS